MALIDDIVAKLNAIPVADDQSLTLTPSAFDLDFMTAFFKQVIGGDSFRIRQAVKTRVPGEISVGGQADFLGYKGLSVKLSFAALAGSKNGDVAAVLDGSFAGDKAVRLPVLSWIGVSNIGLTTTFSGPYNIVTFMFHADVMLAGDAAGGIPVSIGSVDSNTWQLDIAGGASNHVTAEQLVALLSGNALNSFLPQKLIDALEGLQVNDLNASFNTATRRVSNFTAGVTVENGWDIITDLSLRPGLQLILTLLDPTDPDSREAIGVVTGTFLINTVEVPVFVQVDVSGGSSSWVLGLDPKSRGVTLPSMSDLFVLAGGRSFADSLPAGLKDIPQINVSKLEIDFTLSPGSLQLLSFAAKTTSPWPVIEGFLTVEKLEFELDLLNLTDAASRQVGGRLASTFAVTDAVWLYFIVRKEPASADWTLTGGLPPEKSLNLTDLVTKMLGRFVTLPPGLPVIVFDTLNTTVVPGKSMTFTAGSRSKWALIPGKLEIDSFNFTFDYNALATTNKFGGALETDIEIAGAPVHLSASMNTAGAAGLVFDGSTPPGHSLAVGDLVSDLDAKFRVTVPEPVRSFALEDIGLHFVGGSEADGAGPKEFDFRCTGKFSIAGADVKAMLGINIKRKDKATAYDKHVEGKLVISKAGGGAETFTVTFSEDDSDEFIIVTWAASEGHELTVEDVARAFGFQDIPSLPPSLKALGLANVDFTYDFVKKILVIGLVIKKSGSAKSFGRALFISDSVSPGKQVYVIGLDIHLGVKLADLPLVGDKLPDAQNLGIDDAGIWVLSQSLSKDDADKINLRIDKEKYPTLPAQDITAKVLLSADLQLGGGSTKPLQLALGSQTTPPKCDPPTQPAQPATEPTTQPTTQPAQQALTTTTPPPTDNTKWIDVQKQFGVFQFQRIGVNYEDDTLMFALDAAVALGPLTFTMTGLSIGSPLTEFEPKFDLSGLGVSYVKPPLEITGGLLKIPGSQLAPGVRFQFDGVLVMKSLNYSLAAIGSYAQTTDAPSLFVFAQLEAALGGPPAFFVTGLMAGFGFNRSLEIPAQDEVAGFPLLTLAQPPAPGDKVAKQDPMHVLAVLEGREPITPGGETRHWIRPSTGDYWLAVGIEFMSFELVKSKALLIVEFGNDFQIVLLGLSTMRLPQTGDQLYAYVELQLKAVFKPQDGFFGLTAILSNNSFVIDPACHLTGGFAFFLWFGPHEHAGEFVITLGGYHPAFKPPDYFPQVPRLGFNWAVSDVVSVKGDAYFALTTSCVMAGGGLEILFHSGNLRAWFTAHADLLISWHPFFFLAHIDVDIGVSYRLNLLFCYKTISLSLGATVDLWGPPTGGRVHVHLWVISFTVSFGSDGAGQQNDALKWGEFKNLLPAPNDVCKITVSDGLYKSEDSAASTSGQAWVVRASNFRCFTQSTIPATSLTGGGATFRAAADDGADGGAGISIRPMNMGGVTSTHSVSLYRGKPAVVNGKITNPPADVSQWTFEPRRQNMPESLWGAPPSPFSQIPDRPTANVVPDQLVGYDVQAPQPALAASPGPVGLKQLSEGYVLPPSTTPISAKVAASPDYVPSFDDLTVAQIAQIAQDNTRKNRDAIFNFLQGARVYAGPNGALTEMAARANELFSDSPMRQS